MLALIPPDWPLRLLSSFVTRSLRRSLHARHEGQLVKAISASENLAVADAAWRVLREQGAMLEEALDGEDDGEEVDPPEGVETCEVTEGEEEVECGELDGELELELEVSDAGALGEEEELPVEDGPSELEDEPTTGSDVSIREREG